MPDDFKSPSNDNLLLPMNPYPPAKLESNDDFLLQPSSSTNRNFRSKKRNRVMQSCVACHSQKRKCDRKRPCTRCTEHGIAGQCVYQLEDPAIRDGPEQDELLRLRSRVAELERTVRVLMQKPLSRRAAAALEAETDAILGTTSTRKRKVEKDRDADDRARKLLKCETQPLKDQFPEWAALPDPAFPSPVDSPFSPYAPTPSESHYPHHYIPYADFTPPGDVPTPPYSTFPTPSSDAGSPFKIPDPPARRFSDGSALATMLSHTTMASQTPESMAASSPASIAPPSIPGGAPAGDCGCGVNPIGNEVYTGLLDPLDAAYNMLCSLPDHQAPGPCALVHYVLNLKDQITMALGSNNATAVSAPLMQPPPPPGPPPMAVNPPTPAPPQQPSYITPAPSAHMTPASTSHVSPAAHLSPSVSEPGPSPHSSIATPPNYHLYSNHPHSQPFYHSDVPTVVGFNSLSSWASFSGSSSLLNQGTSPSSLSNFDGHKNPHPHIHNVNGSNVVVFDQAQQ
ncbi:hypothetical protein FRB99_004244 [Tulasnella sp. 403]|nr:hypothetical protein FRB99_004244 [Tulasnella sp. 403]